MKQKIYHQSTERWYLERIIFLIVGIFIFFALGATFVFDVVWTLYFAFFVSAILINFSVTGYCPMAILLDRLGIKEK